MIAAWLADGRVSLRDGLPEPEPAADEALIAVRAAGICGTDLALLAGYRSFEGIPGHEFVGVVEEGPPGWTGARVVSEVNVTCSGASDATASCRACAAGRPTHCERRTAVGIFGRDGAFAERVALPIRNLHRVPDEIDDEDAVFAEPLAAAFRVLEQVPISGDTRALVVGPGRLGLLVARAIATTGARPTVAGRSAPGLERARASGLGAVETEAVERGVFDVAVDCTGHPDGFGIARRALRPAGTLVVKSTYPAPFEVDAASLAIDEIRVVGSRCGPFPPALDALARGAVEVADLVEARYPLADAPTAFEHAARPGVAKVLLTP